MEQPESPTSGPTSGASSKPALWVAVGLLAGGGIAIAVMSAMRPPPSSNVVSQQGASVGTPSGAEYHSDTPEDGEPKLPIPENGSNPSATSKPNTTAAEYSADKEPAKPTTGVPQPKPLPGGSIGTSGGGVEPISPTVVIGEQPTAQVEHFEFQESMAETEFDGELAQALSTIRKSGGQVLAQFSRDPERPERGTEVYASIDATAAGKLREALKLASGSETSHWAGTTVERSTRILRTIREERSRLATLLVDYQSRFTDDAMQVVDTKAAIDRCDKALGALSRVGEGKTTFRLLLGR